MANHHRSLPSAAARQRDRTYPHAPIPYARLAMVLDAVSGAISRPGRDLPGSRACAPCHWIPDIVERAADRSNLLDDTGAGALLAYALLHRPGRSRGAGRAFAPLAVRAVESGPIGREQLTAAAVAERPAQAGSHLRGPDTSTARTTTPLITRIRFIGSLLSVFGEFESWPPRRTKQLSSAHKFC